MSATGVLVPVLPECSAADVSTKSAPISSAAWRPSAAEIIRSSPRSLLFPSRHMTGARSSVERSSFAQFLQTLIATLLQSMYRKTGVRGWAQADGPPCGLFAREYEPRGAPPPTFWGNFWYRRDRIQMPVDVEIISDFPKFSKKKVSRPSIWMTPSDPSTGNPKRGGGAPRGSYARVKGPGGPSARDPPTTYALNQLNMGSLFNL